MTMPITAAALDDAWPRLFRFWLIGGVMGQFVRDIPLVLLLRL